MNGGGGGPNKLCGKSEKIENYAPKSKNTHNHKNIYNHENIRNH